LRRLAALAFAFAFPQPPDVTSLLPSAIRHPAFVIRHLPFVIRRLSFPIPRSAFRLLRKKLWPGTLA